MRRVALAGCAFLLLVASVSGAGCKVGLAENVGDVEVAGESAVAALLSFGREKGVCFGLESLGLDLLAQHVNFRASNPSVSSVLQTVLEGKQYQVSESGGVVLVRNAATRADVSQLDTAIASYVIPKEFSLAWASMGLFVRLERLADPSIQSVAGSLSDRHPNDRVGPIDEYGRTARELLTIMVGRSAGAAWVSGPCSASPVRSSKPCWTVLEYRDEPDVFYPMVNDLVGRLISEQQSAKKSAAQ
jgi:hypothetical protein